MKTNKIFIVALACLAVVSCAKEVNGPSSLTTADAFTAVKEDFEVTSKAVLNGRKSVWEAGDEVAVYADAAAAVKFTAVTAGTSAEFAAESQVTGSSFMMVYPYSAAKGVQDGKLLVNVPNEQTPVTASFDPAAAVSVASETALSQPVNFKNALTLLKVNIPADLDGKVVKITVEAKNGEALAGNVLVDPTTKANSLSSNGKSSVSVVSAVPMATGDYYLAVRPCTVADGVKVSVLLGDKTVYTRESDSEFEFVVNTIYNMGIIGTTGWSKTYTEYSLSTVLGSLTAADNAIVTGTGAAARLRSPQEIDAAPDGNFWITTRFDAANHGVWKMTPDYTLSKIAVVADDADLTGVHTWGAAFDPTGKYHFAAKAKHKVMTCSPEGSVDPLSFIKGESAYTFSNPMTLDFDYEGNMFLLCRQRLVKFSGNQVVQEWELPELYTDMFSFNADRSKLIIFGYLNIYEIDLDSSSSEVKVIAGGNNNKHTNSATYTDGSIGYPKTARLNTCWGAVCFNDGTIMFGDQAAKTIRLLIPDVYGTYENATITTILGSAWSGGVAASAQATNCKDGKGTAGLLSSPGGMTFDAQGNVLFVDGLQNGMVRKITWTNVTEKCDMSGDHQDYAGTDGMVSIF